MTIPFLGAYNVLFWGSDSGSGDSQAFSSLQDAVTILGGGGAESPPEKWTVHIACHRPALDTNTSETHKKPAHTKDLHIVTLPGKGTTSLRTIFVNREEKKVMETDTTAKTLLDGFKAFKSRSTLALEGLRYRAGDVRITLARCTQRPSLEFKGIFIVLEYLPAVDSSSVSLLLKELEMKMKDAAESAVSGAHLVKFDDMYDEYGLVTTTGEHRVMHLAVTCAEL